MITAANAKWLAPAAVFVVGAVFGRIFGIRPLVRGAMTAASVTGLLAAPALEAPKARSRAPARRVASRPARKKVAHRRSRTAAAEA